MQMHGYADITMIHHGARSLVYRAVKNDHRVIIKKLAASADTPAERVRYRNEHNIIQALQFAGAVEVEELIADGDSLLLVERDIGGDSLRAILERRRLTLVEAMEIGRGLTAHLAHVHARHVIHKDVNPANVVWNERTGQIQIIDYGISTLFSRETPAFETTRTVRGTLAYTAPEQTGRMNRVIDYRADYYSLGATLYELVTGKTMFPTADAVELLHCQLARRPKAPHEVDAAVPTTLSRLIMKLVEKRAEERYQSAHGIVSDLERCLEEYRASGTISAFELASRDRASSLQISQKLYGRADEAAKLLQSFDRVSKGAREVMLVSGYSGIGKTAVVQEVHIPITRQRGFFLRGKYNQLQRDVPNTAISEALGGLVEQLQSEDDATLGAWVKRIREALGPNASALFELAPGLEGILGEQPPLPEVDAAEALVRFTTTFRKLIQVFARAEHPLVLFLDDLQWADRSSLRLIETLATDRDITHLLLIGAYRDNEVSPTHPTMTTLESIGKRGVPIHHIHLSVLPSSEVEQLTADTLSQTVASARELSAVIFEKTAGNPFFVYQFIRELERTRLLSFSIDHGRWEWDLAAIRARGFTDNVVELLVARMRQLPKRAQEALRTAALLGARFLVRDLAVALELSEGEVFADLHDCLEESIVVPSGRLSSSDGTLTGALVVHALRFGHDRLQQAAYSLLDPADRAAAHLKIGRQLREHLDASTHRPELHFEIAEHLNLGRALLPAGPERDQLMRLNVEAGERALANQAPQAARSYFEVALEDLDALWKLDANLGFRAMLGQSEAEARSSAHEASEKTAEELLRRIDAHLDGDKIKRTQAFTQIVRVLAQRMLFPQARVVGAKALAMFGIDMPLENEMAAVPGLLGDVEALMAGRPASALAQLPEARDPEALIVIQLLAELADVAFMMGPNIFAVYGLIFTRWSLQRGVVGRSGIGIATYGVVLLALGKPVEAERVTAAGIALADRFDDPAGLSLAVTLREGLSAGFVLPLRDLFATLDRGARAGVLAGKPHHAGYNFVNRIGYGILAGDPLPPLQQSAREVLEFATETRSTMPLDFITAVGHIIAALRRRTPDVRDIVPGGDDALIKYWLDTSSVFGLIGFFNFRSLIHTLYGDPMQAAADAQSALPFLPYIGGHMYVPFNKFMNGLTHARAAAMLEGEKRDAARAIAVEALGMLRAWADVNAATFEGQWALVAAELALVDNDTSKARDHYEHAIDVANAQRCLWLEGIATERYAVMLQALRRPLFARTALGRSRTCFEQWGATAKVADLDARYPDLAIGARTISSTSDTSADTVDLMSFVTASESIAGEIVWEKLLAAVLRVVIQNSGAERGALLIEREGVLEVVADGRGDGSALSVAEPISLDLWDGPRSLVHVVRRSLDTIVVNDAATDVRFHSDPYVERTQAHSMLAMPLLHQGKLIALLFLENQLTSGAFHVERCKLLRLLAGQLSAALENARLYQDVAARGVEMAKMARLETERTHDLQLASMMQSLFLPKSTARIPGLNVASVFRPAAECSGDWWWSHAVGDDELVVLVADVSGHGVAPALVTGSIATAIRMLFARRDAEGSRGAASFDQVLRGAHEQLVQMGDGKFSATLTAMLLDIKSGQLTVWSFGAPPVLHVRDGVATPLENEATAGEAGSLFGVGAYRTAAPLQLALKKGDRFFSFTDGLSEQLMESGRRVGLRRLLKLTEAVGGDPLKEACASLMSRFDEARGSAAQEDDVTLLAVELG
jgi:predicted ATPase/serine phosphatase RsbU (regulator of sigma subunit)/tRNA A-37 threonylcarbamoyl transferase component Bud32